MSHQQDTSPTSNWGATSLIAGLGLAVLRLIEQWSGIPAMPRFWYTNQAVWWILVFVLLALGIRQLLTEESASLIQKRRWMPTRAGRRFRQIVVYTRQNCPLCNDAIDLLNDYAAWFPPVMLVDIDNQPELTEKFTNEVPVVECDGKIRFRGRIEESLLRRLIEGTTPVET